MNFLSKKKRLTKDAKAFISKEFKAMQGDQEKRHKLQATIGEETRLLESSNGEEGRDSWVHSRIGVYEKQLNRIPSAHDRFQSMKNELLQKFGLTFDQFAPYWQQLAKEASEAVDRKPKPTTFSSFSLAQTPDRFIPLYTVNLARSKSTTSSSSSSATSKLMSTEPSPLKGVRCLLFDTFGTLTDWETSISRALKTKARNNAKSKSAGPPASASHLGVRIPIDILEIDWMKFTRDWRAGYMKRTREIAAGGEGPNNIDELHLELLHELLDSSEYEAAGQLWASEYERKKVVQLWHRIETWPDVKMGLSAIRKIEPTVLTATLSNGNLRLLVDIARTNNLQFDAHFSGDLLQSYKPNSKMYLGAPALLGYSEEDIKRGKVAMVASHVNDLRAAASFGLKTIYIPRKTEDRGVEGGGYDVKAKKDGGEVDVVLKNGLEELAGYLRQ